MGVTLLHETLTHHLFTTICQIIQEPDMGNILISAVVGKRGSDLHSYYDNIGYEGLISAIKEQFNAGYKITDLYSYMFNSDVCYLAVFSPEHFECK